MVPVDQHPLAQRRSGQPTQLSYPSAHSSVLALPPQGLPLRGLRPVGGALTLALLGCLLLWLGVWATPAQPGDDREGEIHGVIIGVPNQPNGIGDWRLRSLSGRIYRVSADEETRFEPNKPGVGQRVKVKGRWVTEQWLRAEKFEREEDDALDGNKVKGILLTVPPSGIGEWVIQTARQLTITLLVDNGTQLDDGIPPLSRWLEVRGQWQAGNRFQATRIRVDDHELNEVVVRLQPGVISATVASRYGLTGQATLLASGNIYLFGTEDDEEEQSLPRLRRDADVIWAELNYVGGIPQGHGYKTWRWGGEDPAGYVNQNAFAQINLGPALAYEQGAGMVIAVLDTGIDLTHPAFTGRLLTGYDMVADDSTPQDEGDGLGWGHGTHISGIIAKVSPQSKLLPVRVLDTNGRGNTFTLAYAIEWAAAQGADVINLSLGAESDSRLLRDTIAQVIDQGVIVVAAAGNLGNNVTQYPASYPSVISVTAVDSAGIKADFANYGFNWVDIAAPGVGITSTMISSQGSGYASWSGTSMAAGFVSGTAALLRKQWPTAPVALIENHFAAYARNVNGQNPAYVGQLGGLLDAGAAVEAIAEEPLATPTPTVTGTPSPTATPTQPALATPTPSTPTALEQHSYLPWVAQNR